MKLPRAAPVRYDGHHWTIQSVLGRPLAPAANWHRRLSNRHRPRPLCSTARRAFPFDSSVFRERDSLSAMAKPVRQSIVRLRPNRLVVERLEDRSVPSAASAGFWPPAPRTVPPADADGPVGIASGADLWQGPDIPWGVIFAGPTRPAGPAPFADGNPPAPDGTMTTQDWATGGDEGGTHALRWLNADGPSGSGFALGFPGLSAPALGASGTIEISPAHPHVIRPGSSATADPRVVSDRPPPNPGAPGMSAVAEAGSDNVRINLGKQVTRLEGADQGISGVLANPRLTAVSLDPVGLPVVPLADRPPVINAGPATVFPGSSAWQLPVTIARGSDGRGSAGGLDTAVPDALAPDRRSANEPGGATGDSPAPSASSADQAPPAVNPWTLQAGLIPLDPKALGQSVQELFKSLGFFGTEADRDSIWSRWAPWLTVIMTVGLGYGFFRRRPGPAPAPDAAEPPRRGLSWRWSNEFSRLTPPDRL
jgi:hypothetical protein